MRQLSAKEAELVERYASDIPPLVSAVLKRLPDYVERDDLESACREALCGLVQRWDPDQGAFSTYADRRLRGAIVDELRGQDAMSRDLRTMINRLNSTRDALAVELDELPTEEAIAERAGVTIKRYRELRRREHIHTAISAEALTRDSVGADAFVGDEPTPEALLIARDTRDLLTRAIGSLPKRLRLVASLYYQDGRLLREIGDILGVTEARACQMRGEAVRRLRDILEGWGEEDR